MESLSLNNRILATFIQIKNAIVQILKWNEDIKSSEDYYLSEEGMKILAASCMMIEAIGEGIKKINNLNHHLYCKVRSNSYGPTFIFIQLPLWSLTVSTGHTASKV